MSTSGKELRPLSGSDKLATLSTVRVRLAVTPPVARIRLIHPPLNVIDIPMMLELQEALAELEARLDVSTILFEGDARAFSAGVDVKAHVPEQVGKMLTSFHGVIRAIVASRKITTATLLGDSRRSSWAAIRRWPPLRFPRWLGRSAPANSF